jgi:phosphoglycolate phosphatase-like HAD superfamily hydrolase
MTLISSRPSILAAFEAVAGATRVAIDLETVEARLGLKLEDELAHWFAPAQVSAAAAIYRQHYLTLIPLTHVLPGAHAALAAATAQDGSTAIITAKHESSAVPSLAAAGLQTDRLFTLVHGPEKAAVLQRIGASLYVGDTPADTVAATGAGVLAVGVTTGSFAAPTLAAAGANVIFSSSEEFPDWYRSFHAS